MADDIATTTPSWHDGLEPDTLGHLTNRGWDKLTAEEVAREAVKAHRNLERMQRVPADQLLRLPKQDDPAEVAQFWKRLGMPEKPEEYEFGDMNWNDDAEVTARFREVARAAAADLHMPKEMAEKFTRALVDWQENQSAEEETLQSASKKAEEQELFQAWGPQNSPNYRANAFIVDRALVKLGIDQPTADAMRDQIGLKRFMEAFHQIGQALGEDKFVSTEGVTGITRGPISGASAADALSKLKADPAWRKRLLAKDQTALRQFQELTRAQMSP